MVPLTQPKALQRRLCHLSHKQSSNKCQLSKSIKAIPKLSFNKDRCSWLDSHDWHWPYFDIMENQWEAIIKASKTFSWWQNYIRIKHQVSDICGRTDRNVRGIRFLSVFEAKRFKHKKFRALFGQVLLAQWVLEAYVQQFFQINIQTSDASHINWIGLYGQQLKQNHSLRPLWVKAR